MNQAYRIRFGIGRFLICVAVFGVLFACNRHLGWIGFALALISGSALSLLVVIAGKNDRWRIVVSAVSFLCGLICAPVPSGIRGYSVIVALIISAVGCWFVGCILIRLLERIGRESQRPLRAHLPRTLPPIVDDNSPLD